MARRKGIDGRWLERAAVAAVFFLCSSAFGFEGRVISVHDGDTLTILVDRQLVRVRLAEIDAPELGQPFGRRSRESLVALCAGQLVKLQDLGLDSRKERTIGRVNCRQTDAGSHQVLNGLAWVFDRYADPKSLLYPLQAAAIAERRGLWSDKEPVPPWEWRKGRAVRGIDKSNTK